jgi:large subunit ribosomal protein L24
MSLGIKKGDKVQVIAGRDKGKTGKVLKFVSGRKRVVVEGVNLVKKHMRRRSEGEPGGIKEIPTSIDISNLALFCARCGRGTRFGIKIMADNSKVRVCKKCNQTV